MKEKEKERTSLEATSSSLEKEREQHKCHLNRHTPNVFANRRAATDATHSSVYFAHKYTQTNKALALTRTFMLIDEKYDKDTLTHASKQKRKLGRRFKIYIYT